MMRVLWSSIGRRPSSLAFFTSPADEVPPPHGVHVPAVVDHAHAPTVPVGTKKVKYIDGPIRIIPGYGYRSAAASLRRLLAAPFLLGRGAGSPHQPTCGLQAHRRRGAGGGCAASPAPTEGRRSDARRVPCQSCAARPGAPGSSRAGRGRIPSTSHRVAVDRGVRGPRYVPLTGGCCDVPAHVSRSAGEH